MIIVLPEEKQNEFVRMALIELDVGGPFTKASIKKVVSAQQKRYGYNLLDSCNIEKKLKVLLNEYSSKRYVDFINGPIDVHIKRERLSNKQIEEVTEIAFVELKKLKIMDEPAIDKVVSAQQKDFHLLYFDCIKIKRELRILLKNIGNTNNTTICQKTIIKAQNDLSFFSKRNSHIISNDKVHNRGFEHNNSISSSTFNVSVEDSLKNSIPDGHIELKNSDASESFEKIDDVTFKLKKITSCEDEPGYIDHVARKRVVDPVPKKEAYIHSEARIEIYKNNLHEYKQKFKVISLISSIGAYCKSSDNKFINMITSLLNTVNNIFDDPRSDFYIKTLCNMFSASFVLNAKKNDELLIPCYVGLRVIKKIIDTCDSRIVFENITPSNKINEITLNLDDYIKDCGELIDEIKTLNEVGYNSFCLFFDEIYSWDKQIEERNGLERDIIILYVKSKESANNSDISALFNHQGDYITAATLFAERGIFRCQSSITPRNYNVLSYLLAGDEDADIPDNIFKTYTSDVHSLIEGHIVDKYIFEVWNEIIMFVNRSYKDGESWKEKIVLNSALAYMLSPRRYIYENEPIHDGIDLAVCLTAACSMIARDSAFLYDLDEEDITTNNESNPYSFFAKLENINAKLYEIIENRYGFNVLLDILSRPDLLEAEKVIDWTCRAEAIDYKDYLTLLESERSSILYLTRSIDKNIGNNPGYKNRFTISNSLDFEQLNIVNEIEESIQMHSPPSVRKLRAKNKINLDLSEAMLNYGT